MSTFSMDFTPATSLYRRRLARNLVNWGMIGSLGLIAAMAWSAQVPAAYIVVWGIVTSIILVIDEISSPVSLLLRVKQWLSRRVLFRKKIDNMLSDDDNLYWAVPEPHFFDYGLFTNRERFRWILFLLILLSVWGFGVLQSTAWPVPAEVKVSRVVLTLLLFGFAAIPFGMLTAELMVAFPWGKSLWLWIIAALIGTFALAYALQQITSHPSFSILPAASIGLIYFFAYTAQRLWRSERAYARVIQELSLKFLSSQSPKESLEVDVPALIGQKLRYERVFVLLATEDRQRLEVIGQYGDFPTVINKSFSIEAGITGKAFREKKTVFWNDVERCPFYLDLTEGNENDDTRSEVAIPIEHNAEIYGVLSVQSDRANVFGAPDEHWLKVIAGLLGAVISARKSDFLIDAAFHSWEQLSTVRLSSVEAIFEQFAQLALPAVGASRILYYPLSPGGYPLGDLYSYGADIGSNENSNAPSYLGEPLIESVRQWETKYEFSGKSCLIPVGMGYERLGLFIWYFDKAKVFDSIIRFTLLSLSQGFATAVALVRYRDMFFEGFGRPQLTVHNIVGRHGLKLRNGVLACASEAFTNHHVCTAVETGKIDDCALYPALSQANECLNEIGLADSTMPPNFWFKALKDELQAFINDLPTRPNQPSPRVELNIDPRVERDSPWIKLALYRLVVEAVDNALHHGHATIVEVTVNRESGKIAAQITNNGNPLPEDAEMRRSKHGIFSHLDTFRELYGAVTGGPTQRSNQVSVSVSIPCVPFTVEETIL